MRSELEDVLTRIHMETGSASFNPNSPKQLGEMCIRDSYKSIPKGGGCQEPGTKKGVKTRWWRKQKKHRCV